MSLTTDVRLHLISQGVAVGGTTQDWTCLIGGLSDQVARAQIAVMETGGLAPLDVMGTGDTETLTRPGVQILVRGNANDYSTTEAKAQAVWTTLHRQSFADFLTIEGTTNPIWLGYEPDTNRPLWSLNFLTVRR